MSKRLISILLLFAMIFFCVLNGVLPVVGAYISKDILNVVAELIGVASYGSISDNIRVLAEPLLVLFVAYFIYQFLNKDDLDYAEGEIALAD